MNVAERRWVVFDDGNIGSIDRLDQFDLFTFNTSTLELEGKLVRLLEGLYGVFEKAAVKLAVAKSDELDTYLLLLEAGNKLSVITLRIGA